MKLPFPRFVPLAAGLALLAGPLLTAHAYPRVNRNVNVNRSGSINRNVNVNRDYHRHVDVDVDVRRRGGYGAGLAAGLVTGAVIGAAVATPPRGYATVYYGSRPYVYYGGTYYQPGPSGYVVVAPPVGIVVPVLPPGCAPAVINGITCYGLNGLYYQPVMVGGIVQYRTVVF